MEEDTPDKKKEEAKETLVAKTTLKDKLKTNKKELIIIITVFLIFSVFIVVIFFILISNLKNNEKSINTESDVISEKLEDKNIEEEVISLPVEWKVSPEKVNSVDFLRFIDKYFPYKVEYVLCKEGEEDCGMELGYVDDVREPKATYYLVGRVNNGEYKDGLVYLSVVRNLPYYDNLGWGEMPAKSRIAYKKTDVYMFIKLNDGRFVVTNDYSNNYLFCSPYRPCEMNEELKNWLSKAGYIFEQKYKLDNAELNQYLKESFDYSALR